MRIDETTGLILVMMDNGCHSGLRQERNIGRGATL